MSVYTELTEAELAAFLGLYPVGTLLSFEGIASGVENTNYRVVTSEGRYVLTLVETLPVSMLGYFIKLLNHAVACQLPVVELVAHQAGDCTQILKGKPALLAKEIVGSTVATPSVHQVEQIARFLARFHLCFQASPLQRENDRWHEWREEKMLALAGKLSFERYAQVQTWNQQFLNEPWDRLPDGVVHGDLFRDNALFDGDVLSGVLDFYNACSAPWLWDVAICLNDWCVSFEKRQLKPSYTQAFIRAYQSVRPFTGIELEMINVMRQMAAFRFFLSRTYDRVFPKQGNIVTLKSPEEFWWLLHALG